MEQNPEDVISLCPSSRLAMPTGNLAVTSYQTCRTSNAILVNALLDVSTDMLKAAGCWCPSLVDA
jgi:hypothetical protein